jgi:hypothetical protein
VSAVVPPHIQIHDGPGRNVPGGILFSMIVGRQGNERKSTALDLGARMIMEASIERVGVDFGSWQAMIDAVVKNPQMFVGFTDYGDFALKTKGGAHGNNYMAPFKGTIMRLWDGTPIGRETVAQKKNTVACPRVSIGAATNLDLFSAGSDAHDFTGGYLSRYNFFTAYRERWRARGKFNGATYKALVDWLRTAIETPPDQIGYCLGPTQDAWALWELYAEAVDTAAQYMANPKMIGIAARAPEQVLRLALVFQYATGAGQPQAGQAKREWYIDRTVMEVAIDVVRRCCMGAAWVYSSAATTLEMQQRRDVLDAIDPNPNTWTRYSVLLRKAKLIARQLDPILRSLVLEGAIVEYDRLAPGCDPLVPEKMFRFHADTAGRFADAAVVEAQSLDAAIAAAGRSLLARNQRRAQVLNSMRGTAPAAPPQVPAQAPPPPQGQQVPVATGYRPQNWNDLEYAEESTFA